jgi:arylformamidase
MRFLDISLPLSANTPVWPGDPLFRLERLSDVDGCDPATLSRLTMGTHGGTHVDAPAHFLPGGGDVLALPFEAMIGPAVVIDATGLAFIDEAALRRLLPNGVPQRLLLRTSDIPLARRPPQEAFLALTTDGARWLVGGGVRLVGVDALSVAGGADLEEVHRALLASGVVVVEGLELSAVAPGAYGLVCLPLALVSAEAAPARAVLTSASP